MCKLCGTNTQYVLPYNNILVSEDAKVFHKIVKDYTGNLPCNTCQKRYIAYSYKYDKSKPNKPKLDKDSWIMKRLLSVYGPRKNVAIKKYRMDNHTPKAVFTRIEAAIWHIQYSVSERFQASACVKGKAVVKKFKTLKEAKEFRQRILNDNKRT